MTLFAPILNLLSSLFSTSANSRKAMAESLESLAATVNTLSERVHTLEVSRAVLVGEKIDLAELLRKQIETNVAARSEIQQLRKELQELKEGNETLHQDNQRLMAQNNRLEQKLESCVDDITEHTQEFKRPESLEKQL